MLHKAPCRPSTVYLDVCGCLELGGKVFYCNELFTTSPVDHDRDITIELTEGSIIAVKHLKWWQFFGTMPSAVTMETEVPITWLDQERAQNKPKWRRGFMPSKKFGSDSIHVSDILLYDITLNPKAKTLKKTTREELERLYAEFVDNDWREDLANSKRK